MARRVKSVDPMIRRRTGKATLKRYEAALGEPAEEWAGRCYEIASRVVRAGLVQGVAVYGHFIGEVDPRSRFYRHSAAGFVQHGWIRLLGGDVVDPTRWVFEASLPYIYRGTSECYDEGGNRLRERFVREPPVYNRRARQLSMELSKPAAGHVEQLLKIDPKSQGGRFSDEQVFWLANLPYDAFGFFVGEVYAAMEKAGAGAYVPIDNMRRAFREHPEVLTNA